ncbi:hypothetical protein H9Q08_05565 [Chryseobacterium sp. PS-8]|uniref:Uncharacterized protein n=1 Tax=Chryseobacterium indicum TaxID=2766954 RepID=A0ABS9C4A9_9FLAO|nr:hypothetical protein [Chryseobacterium sp. PS-8]MCF2218765.1 hypothetical protein [Chryseobacterium sp. PS-8]
MKNKLFLLALSFCFVGTFAQSQKCNKTIEASDSIEVINVKDGNTYCVTKNITVKEIMLNGGNLLINEALRYCIPAHLPAEKTKLLMC